MSWLITMEPTIKVAKASPQGWNSAATSSERPMLTPAWVRKVNPITQFSRIGTPESTPPTMLPR